VSPVYVYAVYFYINRPAFTKMTHMHDAMQYSKTESWRRKLGYVYG